jgi:hypothetical protein
MSKSIIKVEKRYTDSEIAKILGWKARDTEYGPKWDLGKNLTVFDTPNFTTSIDAIVSTLNDNGFCYELYYSHKKTRGRKGKASVWIPSYNPNIYVGFEIGNEAMALCQAFARLMETLRKYDPKYKDVE